MGIIAKQGFFNSIFSYVGILLGFISIVYVQPNFLSTSEIGLTRILVSFSFMAAIFVPLGIGSVTSRFFPKIKNKDNNHHGHFFLILVFSLIGSLILSIFFYVFKSNIVNYYQEKSPLFNEFYNLVYVFPFILALILVYNIYLASLYKTIFAVFLNEVLTRVFQIGVIFVYYFGYLSLNQFIYAFVGIYFLQLLLLVVYIYLLDSFTFKINWKFYKSFFSKQVVLFSCLMIFTAFASIGIKIIDQLIMGHYLSLSYIGIYATSIFMVSVMEVPYNALERISSPVIAQSWSDNNLENIRKIYYDSVRVLMFIGGYLMIGLLCCSNSIFELLPSEFSIGKNCMIVMAFSSFLNLATGINSTIIATSHKYFTISVFLFILILLSVVTNILLIPKFGILGSAFSTFISIGTYNLLKVIYLWYRLKMVPYNKKSLVISLTILVSGLVYFVPDFSNPYLSIFTKGTLITLVFFFSMLRFKIVEEISSKIPFLNVKTNR